jgi:cobalamin biosynthesis Mg chelatase CobN
MDNKQRPLWSKNSIIGGPAGVTETPTRWSWSPNRQTVQQIEKENVKPEDKNIMGVQFITKNAERIRKKTSSLSQEEKAAKNRKDAERKQKKRSSLTQEEKAAMNQKDAEMKKDKRDSLSQEEKAAMNQKDAEMKKDKRDSLSQAEKAAMNQKDAEMKKDKRDSLSQEEKAAAQTKVQGSKTHVRLFIYLLSLFVFAYVPLV